MKPVKLYTMQRDLLIQYITHASLKLSQVAVDPGHLLPENGVPATWVIFNNDESITCVKNLYNHWSILLDKFYGPCDKENKEEEGSLLSLPSAHVVGTATQWALGHKTNLHTLSKSATTQRGCGVAATHVAPLQGVGHGCQGKASPDLSGQTPTPPSLSPTALERKCKERRLRRGVAAHSGAVARWCHVQGSSEERRKSIPTPLSI